MLLLLIFLFSFSIYVCFREHFYLRRSRLYFWFGLFVCLSVCPSDNGKSCERILTKFLEGARGPMSSILVTIRITVQIKESEVRNLHLLDYRRSYKRILMKFYGELGCGLETNWLHFGDDLHHYPDLGVRNRSGSWSGSWSGSNRKELPRQHTQNRCPQCSPNDFNFGDDPDHRPDSGVRSPKSGFTGLAIMLAIGGGLRCLSTSSLFSFCCVWL